MFKLTYYGRQITITKKLGVFRCLANSATGKTFLANILKSLYVSDSSITSYTYSDYRAGVSLDDVLSKGISLIFIDRLDMYATEEVCNTILKYRDKATIIVDLKHPCRYLYNVGVCSIDLKVGGIDVILY